MINILLGLIAIVAVLFICDMIFTVKCPKCGHWMHNIIYDDYGNEYFYCKKCGTKIRIKWLWTTILKKITTRKS